MRTPLLLLLALSIGIGFIYYAGNFTPTNTPRPHFNPTVQLPPTAAVPAPASNITPEQARQLTSQQRLDLLRKSLDLPFDDNNSIFICGLIQALTKEELSEASKIIRDTELLDVAYLRIHEALSLQWGRLDPLPFSAKFKESDFLYGQRFAQVAMEGWFETDPAAALAWAQEPKTTTYEYIMAASVITLSAAGDPQKLADTLLVFPATDGRVVWCLPTYFALVATTTGNPDYAAIYKNIPAPLREAAWAITIDRLTHAAPQAAADWLSAHVNDPGRDFSVTHELIYNLSQEDTAGTAQWAATFPDDESLVDCEHPAYGATYTWYEKDPAAAKAWLQTQPSTLHWVAAALEKIEERENEMEPEAPGAEN